MNLFDVYPLYQIAPVSAKGSYVYDAHGQGYLDLYGGHGVISVGHLHDTYQKRLSEQLNKIGFYSNSVQNPLQVELARKLGELSECEDYQLFLCNSGAEANENALKLASFVTGKHKLIAFRGAFHGRTSAAVSVTDNPAINANLNLQHEVEFLPLNQIDLVEKSMSNNDVAAVIIEGIQGVGGLDEGTTEFFRSLEALCKKHDVMLILDEIQSGYCRSGDFFAFQAHGISPDLITVAKGMGNGFPIGGVLVSDKIKPNHGMLGTTFGGNHLACSAALAVLEIIEQEQLLSHVNEVSAYFLDKIKTVDAVKKVKGRGLMLGVEFGFKVGPLRKQLIYDEKIFTGGSANQNLLRILPPLNVTIEQIDTFITALKRVVSTHENLKN